MTEPAEQPRGEMSDAALVARAGKGDHAAFEVLYRRHRDFVYRLALRFTGEHALALDATQEVFLYLCRKLPGLTLTARLTTFLYPAVKHCALTAKRKAQRSGLSLESLRGGGWEAGSGAGAESAAAGSGGGASGNAAGREPATEAAPAWIDEERCEARFGTVWRTLSEPHREVLVLRYVAEMTVPEIAAALGVAEGTIKSRLHHACRAFSEGS